MIKEIPLEAIAQNEGYDAYNENRSFAPALSPVIRALVSDMAVGTGADEIFRAFIAGYDTACDAECARIFAEV